MLIDILFTVLLVVLPVLGFFQGFVRFMVLLVMFYISVVLASLYFSSVGKLLEAQFRMDVIISQYAAFALVMVVSFVLLAVAGLYIFRHTHLPSRLHHVDRISGIGLGFVLALFVLAVCAALLWNLLIIREASEVDIAVMQWLGRSVKNSSFLNLLADHFLRYVYILLGPILPDGVEILLEITE